ALAVAVFFTDLTTPWLYIWAYVGVSMRAALIVESARARAERRQRIVAVPRPAVFHKEPMS
ncbi:MAG TPA: hypothetical protein VJ011_00955, partial [Steroidobacteraceae bacterium]|nr:hypothetical protein [Steroidobacteraceae bacterium]